MHRTINAWSKRIERAYDRVAYGLNVFLSGVKWTFTPNKSRIENDFRKFLITVYSGVFAAFMVAYLLNR